MYEPRFYRQGMGSERFRAFCVAYKETDLWIGVSPDSYNTAMPTFTENLLRNIRGELDAYIKQNPEFLTSLLPLKLDATAPECAIHMAQVTQIFNVGPMAAVAGMFSEKVGKALHEEFNCEEVVVENGGDLYLRISRPIQVLIHAGKSILSDRLSLFIPEHLSPLGICTSAGTVGHSLSFGIADAAIAIAKDCSLADAGATALGNMVHGREDIPSVLEYSRKWEDLLGVVVICGDDFGVRGEVEIKIV